LRKSYDRSGNPQPDDPPEKTTNARDRTVGQPEHNPLFETVREPYWSEKIRSVVTNAKTIRRKLKIAGGVLVRKAEIHAYEEP
jgi:hypothetical protein